MTVNIEALTLVVKELESDLSHWWQESYIETPLASEMKVMSGEIVHLLKIDTTHCDTTFCIAGMAIHQAGYCLGENNLVYNKDEDCLGDIEEVAGELLGLNEGQMTNIFHGSAGGGDFTKMKEIITRETGVTFDD